MRLGLPQVSPKNYRSTRVQPTQHHDENESKGKKSSAAHNGDW
jgi:hypothetical protein